MDDKKKSPSVVVLSATVVGIGFCLWRITRSPTENEALLLSLFMTVLSVLASWIVSRYYAKASYEDNLKVFALKAAEKVTNLSSELDRLSSFLQKALDEDDFGSPVEELLAKTIRFEDAIHLITSLRSVNDTSLSDWRGIIGDELSAQREAERKEQKEREQTLQEIMEKMMVIEEESSDSVGVEEQQERERIRTELSALRTDIKALAFHVSGVPFRTFPKRKTVEKACPRCAQPVQFQQGRGTTIKKVECNNCKAKLYSQSDGIECYLKERVPITEQIKCPACEYVEERSFDPLPGTMTEYNCSQCETALRAVRTKKEMIVKLRPLVVPSVPKSTSSSHVDSTGTEMPEELLNAVAKEMGPQPWPMGKSHEARLKLNINRSTIDYALRQLIAKGVFRPQVNGVIYVPPTEVDTDIKPQA